MEISVSEALCRLKLTNKKIEDQTARVVVGHVTTKGSKGPPAGFVSFEEYKKDIQARLDQVEGLIKYRDKLKQAVVASNAKTQVQVGSQKLSVAEAIEKKQSITHKKVLLKHLETHWAAAQQAVERHNTQLDNRADEVLKNLANSSTPDQLRQMREAWVADNTAYVVTPEKTRKMIEDLRCDIEEFEANVDIVLSVANAKTTILVD